VVFLIHPDFVDEKKTLKRYLEDRTLGKKNLDIFLILESSFKKNP